LAGLSSTFVPRQKIPFTGAKIGLGMRQRKLNRPNVLRMMPHQGDKE
jgi:hypothetical protein